MSNIRVVVADDHAVVRNGVRMLIGSAGDLEVVGEAANGAEAAAQVQAQQPDLLVLDLTMPDTDAMGLIESLHKDYPEMRILVLTMHDDPAYCRAALGAGAAGYVLKSAVDTELLAAIRQVLAGGPAIDERFLANAVPDGKNLPGTERLSGRE
ncbi:MAG: response regulator transcription factor, partial [Gemmataceae bacterium]